MIRKIINQPCMLIHRYRIRCFESLFRKLTLQDRAWIDQACKEDKGIATYISFLNMYIYQDLYEYDSFRKGIGGSVLKKPWASEGKLHCQYPIGSPVSRQQTAKKIFDLYSRCYQEIVFFGASEENLFELKKMFGCKIINIENIQDGCSYIYNVQEQLTLPGSKFSNIRSKLRRFDKQNNWTYEEVTQANLSECINVNEQWYRCHEKSKDVDLEQLFLKKVVELYDEFDFRGGMIRVDGKPIAFNIGMPHNEDIFVGLIAKADSAYHYASLFMINEFIRHACPEYKYFNFTEDMGNPGLRRFKNELRPEFLTQFYSVTIKVD